MDKEPAKITPEDLKDFHDAIKAANAEIEANGGKLEASKIAPELKVKFRGNITEIKKIIDAKIGKNGKIELPAQHVPPLRAIYKELVLSENFLEEERKKQGTSLEVKGAGTLQTVPQKKEDNSAKIERILEGQQKTAEK